MNDQNQGVPSPEPGPGAASPAPAAGEPPPSGAADTAPAAPLAPRDHEARLLTWLVVIAALGIGGLALGQTELSALVAFAGLLIAAQASDVDLRWRLLYLALAWVIPVAGAFSFGTIGWLIWTSDLAPRLRIGLVVYSGVCSALSLVLWHRPIAERVTRLLFPRETPNHSLRLVARLTVMGLVFPIPAAIATRDKLLEMLQSPDSPLTTASLTASVVGYVVVALAGVGFRIRRTAKETIERLGIAPLRLADLGWAVLGLAALVGFNGGAEWIEKRWFTDLWAQDQAMTDALARNMGVGEGIVLGLSAGIGEEITMRGALQPKLGIVLTAALFAALHVQYSWFGMLLILGLGLLLGVLRKRTSTSVSMLVHAAFDLLAVLAR